MALKAVHVSNVPHLDHVPKNSSVSLCASRFNKRVESVDSASQFIIPKFMVMGHRGNGMNVLQSHDKRMTTFKENSVASFNAASQFPIDYIEFDIQVTKDGCPIIFHDDFIYSEENGTVYEKRVTELSLAEFLSYGPQKESEKLGKTLLRKTKDGKIVNWNVDIDDSLCTLQEAFQNVKPSLGFDIEVKLDDYVVYEQDHLISLLQSIMEVVHEYANDRPILFSSFHPDAARHIRKLQRTYPVFFLTDGGTELYYDARRNSLEEAMKLCLEHGLQGIVSEAKGIFRNPGMVSKIKDSKLSLLTYGKLNNVAEAVYMQYLMGVEAVIVDLVHEITEAVSDLKVEEEEVEGKMQEVEKPRFSERELSFLLKLIPELIQL